MVVFSVVTRKNFSYVTKAISGDMLKYSLLVKLHYLPFSICDQLEQLETCMDQLMQSLYWASKLVQVASYFLLGSTIMISFHIMRGAHKL